MCAGRGSETSQVVRNKWYTDRTDFAPKARRVVGSTAVPASETAKNSLAINAVGGPRELKPASFPDRYGSHIAQSDF